jgi:hypothetical protein
MVERIMRNEEWILRLMDMQKFVGNDKLRPLLDQVGAKYGLTDDPRELADEELELYAAGDPALYKPGKVIKEQVKGEEKADDH